MRGCGRRWRGNGGAWRRERLGSEEWKHLDRGCREVAPEEEGEEGGEPEEEVKKEEVRLTARGEVRPPVGKSEIKGAGAL